MYPARKVKESGTQSSAFARGQTGKCSAGAKPRPGPARRVAAPGCLQSRADDAAAHHGAGVTTRLWARDDAACANTSSCPAQPPATPDDWSVCVAGKRCDHWVENWGRKLGSDSNFRALRTHENGVRARFRTGAARSGMVAVLNRDLTPFSDPIFFLCPHFLPDPVSRDSAFFRSFDNRLAPCHTPCAGVGHASQQGEAGLPRHAYQPIVRAWWVAAPGSWKYSRMPQSHASRPRWSRQHHGAPQHHLRATASCTARTPAALALDVARRQPAGDRTHRAWRQQSRRPSATGTAPVGCRPSAPGLAPAEHSIGHTTGCPRVSGVAPLQSSIAPMPLTPWKGGS